MAVFHGKGGSATFSGIDSILLLSWSIDTSADVAEATDMGDTWKSYQAGFKDWTATLECNKDSTDVGIDALGTTDTLTITATSGKTYSGSAICTGYSPSASKDDIAKLTITFQGTGTLTESF